MKSTSLLEINFFEKCTSSMTKGSVKVQLSLLKNGCYTFSNLESHNLLHNALTEWHLIHKKSENLETLKKKYREFLTVNRKADQFLNLDDDFSWPSLPREELSDLNIDSIEFETDFSDYIQFESNFTEKIKDFGKTFSQKISELNVESEHKCQTVLFNNGFYRGELIDRKPHGYGTMVSTNGKKYIGGFKDGEKSGIGIMSSKDRIEYGDWAHDKLNGKAICKFENGTHYAGEVNNGQIEGYGEGTLVDGTIFRGFFKDDKRHKGIQIDTEGQIQLQIWNGDELVKFIT